MNPQDPLAALQPLREPELVGWWPLAPGWWLLLLLVLVATGTLVYLLLRYYRRNAYRRRGLQQLQLLQNTFLANQDNQYLLTQINALLKSVALAAYPRQDVAARHGAQWAAFLNGTLKSGAPFAEDFAESVYREHATSIDSTQLIDTARLWIKRHRVAT